MFLLHFFISKYVTETQVYISLCKIYQLCTFMIIIRYKFFHTEKLLYWEISYKICVWYVAECKCTMDTSNEVLCSSNGLCAYFVSAFKDGGVNNLISLGIFSKNSTFSTKYICCVKKKYEVRRFLDVFKEKKSSEVAIILASWW